MSWQPQEMDSVGELEVRELGQKLIGRKSNMYDVRVLTNVKL